MAWSATISLLVSFAAAEAQVGYSSTSRADAYGNVERNYAWRRSLGVFQNETQRAAYQGYQTSRRRYERRGGYSPFTVAGDVLALTRFQPGQRVPTPFRPTPSSGWQRRVFDRYGGFGSQLNRTDALRIDTILDRRSELILATSLNAPVHRVYLQSPELLGLPPALATTPFVPNQHGEPPLSTEPLSDRLSAALELEKSRIEQEAWDSFADKNYRRATRSFETLALLEPSDFAPRIGDLFCQVSLGATQTAVARLHELARRVGNPFLPSLTVANAFADPAEALRVRTTVQLQAAIATNDPDLRALHVLVLWYLGEPEEAITSATSLARDHPGSAYGSWPAAMRDARGAAAVPVEPRKP